ncbi:MAG TPA: hypothetical protein VGO80_20860 [Solirubrobacteraceae bacterium]|jgi:hypothetical protein|nr:hypothetical protein [Solirubrobacteraceae bacterium]
MNAVRRLFDELVEKKLWPAALLLIVTAIAVPFLIGGGGDDGASAILDPAATLPARSAASATPAVELVGPPAVRSRGGAVRDPFRRATVKAADTSPGADAAKSASAAKSGGSADATSAAKKSADATSGSDKPAKAKAKTQAQPAIDPATTALARSSYQTVVRFTRPGGSRERPLARLAVLGNLDHLALQYLGVGSGRKHAIFVLGPKATAAGDSACLVADPCRVVRLSQGEKLGVDVREGLVVRHYEVEVIRLRRLHLPSVASARTWRARVDPVGSAVLHTLEQDPVTASVLDRLRYTTRTGTVSLTSAP